MRWRAAAITTLFEQQRRENAAWAVAWEAGAGHEIGRSVRLAQAFLREADTLRNDPRKGPRRLATGQGKIGSRSTYAEVPWPKTPEERVRTVWLPGPNSARLWRDLGQGANQEATDGP